MLLSSSFSLENKLTCFLGCRCSEQPPAERSRLLSSGEWRAEGKGWHARTHTHTLMLMCCHGRLRMFTAGSLSGSLRSFIRSWISSAGRRSFISIRIFLAARYSLTPCSHRHRSHPQHIHHFLFSSSAQALCFPHSGRSASVRAATNDIMNYT